MSATERHTCNTPPAIRGFWAWAGRRSAMSTALIFFYAEHLERSRPLRSLQLGVRRVAGSAIFFTALPQYQEGAGVPVSINDGHVGRGVPDAAANSSFNSGYGGIHNWQRQAICGERDQRRRPALGRADRGDQCRSGGKCRLRESRALFTVGLGCVSRYCWVLPARRTMA